MPARRNAFLTFFAALCALISAIVFAVVVIVSRHPGDEELRPLVARVSQIRTTADAAGVAHLTVDGVVVNQSNDIYGVPDLIIISRDENGNEIARQKFMPSATLLEPGAEASFSHTLAAPAAGVYRVTIEMPDIGG